MRKVTVFTHLTLDGVMQAPGRPDEDRRGGFKHGGWEPPYGDPVMGKVAGEGMAKGGALLLIHPLVLGSGRHLFTNGGAFATLKLVDTKTTTTGVVIATYEPGDAPMAAKG